MAYDVPNTTAHHYTNGTKPARVAHAVKAKESPADSFIKWTGNRGVDIEQFTAKLERMSLSRSASRCARYVRIALQSAGANIFNNPVAASDWGPTLESVGYRKINPQFDNPQVGDIYIIHRTAKHRYGHIAGYTPSGWISDYRQDTHAVYRDPNVSYSYYRLS
ncbi:MULTISPECIES: CHAP domain-containing protein [unclassified Acinetobacter]|uniref:CHAP domain-containing protein n=1 Tax=unclassified Acinetobacter TaxID=196816 RepID=UPI0035B9F06E